MMIGVLIEIFVCRINETNNYSKEMLAFDFLFFCRNCITQSRVLSNSCSKEFQPFHNTNAKDTSADS